MDLLSSFSCGQFQVKKESVVADCVFEKRDKRRLSVQGAILSLICSPIGLSIDEYKMELYMENQTHNITAFIMQLLLPWKLKNGNMVGYYDSDMKRKWKMPYNNSFQRTGRIGALFNIIYACVFVAFKNIFYPACRWIQPLDLEN